MGKIRLLLAAALFLSINSVLFADWQSLGLEGEIIRSMIAKGDAVFVATESGALAKSTDKGETWEELTTGTEEISIHVFLINNDWIYAGTWGGGIIASEDDGVTWSKLNDGLEADEHISGLVVNGSSVFASTRDHGVYRLDQESLKWSESNTGLTDLSVDFIASVDPYMVLYTFDKQFFASSDGGNTWILAPLPIMGKDVSTFTINNFDIFVGVWDEGIYYTNNPMGMTWDTKNEGLDDFSIRTITIKDDIVLTGTDGGVYVSADYASSWKKTNKGLLNLNVQSIIIVGDDVYAGTFQGVYRSGLDELTTGIAENAGPSMPTVRVYPNPSDNFIQVNAGNDRVINSIIIRGLIGNTVISECFSGQSIGVRSVDISGLAPGMYIMTVESDGAKSVRMFVKK